MFIQTEGVIYLYPAPRICTNLGKLVQVQGKSSVDLFNFFICLDMTSSQLRAHLMDRGNMESESH